jgi:dTDP-3-amino-3,4,6-trideoxy-alpha-D-glucose transaminase
MNQINNVAFLDLGAIASQQRPEINEAFFRVMDSNRWILGPELEAFESEFANYVGAKHVVGVGNGLDALSLIFQALGLKDDDQILVPAHTFIATWLAISQANCTPVAVEPTKGQFLPNSQDFIDAFNDKVKAVVVVHLYGEQFDYSILKEFCTAKKIYLVEDAAQAHGASVNGVYAGNLGIAAGFSFYPGKNLGAFGDAGAISTNDDLLASNLKALRNYGSTKRYYHDSLGVNSRLDELQAAFLRVKLQRLDSHNKHRRRLANLYCELLAECKELVLPTNTNDGSHVWHLFVVRSSCRDELQAFLAANGIQTLIHYPIPVYRSPPFSKYAPHNVSPTDEICQSILSLPIGPHLNEDDVTYVAKTIIQYFSNKEHSKS